MRLLNGKTKAAAISAVCALVVAAIALASYIGGWRAKVGDEAVKAEQFSQGLVRLEAVETRANLTGEKVNGLATDVAVLVTNVNALIESQRQTNEVQQRTNDKIDRLSDTLMDDLAARAKAARRVP